MMGGPAQVYAFSDLVQSLVKMANAKNLSALGGPDYNGDMVYIFCPHVVSDLEGTPFAFVGNASNEKGEVSHAMILIENIKYFPVIGSDDEGGDLPEHGRASRSLTLEQLEGTPWSGRQNMRFGLLPNVIPFYFGFEPPQVNVLESDATDALLELGIGYGVMAACFAKARGEDSAAILDLADSLVTNGHESYVQGEAPTRALSDNGPIIATTRVPSTRFPDVTKSVKAWFLPEAPTESVAAPAKAIYRSAEDDQNDSAANLGQIKCLLFFIGGDIDIEKGTISNLNYAIPSDSFEAVMQKPRTLRGDLMRSCLQNGHNQARRLNRESIFSIHSSIGIVQRPLAVRFAASCSCFLPALKIFCVSVS